MVRISRLDKIVGVIEMSYFTIREKKERNYFNTGDFQIIKTCLSANDLNESKKKFIGSALT